MAVTDGLALFRCEDSTADRRQFAERLEGRMKAEAAEACGLSEIDGQTLRSTLRKGWYWGGESFKETLLQKLEGLKRGSMPVAKDFRGSDQARDHDLRDGERIISEAVQQLGLKGGRREAFTALPRGVCGGSRWLGPCIGAPRCGNRGSQTDSDCAAVTTSRHRSGNSPHRQARNFHPRSRRG